MTEQGPIPLDKHIRETEPIQIANTEVPQGGATEPISDARAPSVEYTVKDCENLYGAAMETAHTLIGMRKKDFTHRGLPEERLRMQGKMLHNICTKYNIQIPTELEVLIFGGALVMDFQYMGAKEAEREMKTELTQKAEPTQEQSEDQPEAIE